jgi:transcriptional regulator with XRE-family HTH domain
MDNVKGKNMRIDRLKEVRELRRLSQHDLADRSGISLSQISRYERGESDPTADALTRIAKTLEVSIDYLVGLVDVPNDHVSETDLTAMERRLIWAIRNGFIVEVLKAVTAITEESDQSSVTSR